MTNGLNPASCPFFIPVSETATAPTNVDWASWPMMSVMALWKWECNVMTCEVQRYMWTRIPRDRQTRSRRLGRASSRGRSTGMGMINCELEMRRQLGDVPVAIRGRAESRGGIGRLLQSCPIEPDR